MAELRALDVNSIVQPAFEGRIEMMRRALVPYKYGEARISGLISDLRSDLYGDS